jgi:hypothetical protein
MNKIVLLPLDERPCNMLYPHKMFDVEDIELVLPKYELMGNKKIPGDMLALHAFLEKETIDAYGLVVSMDTLLYGGIVPSRLHNESEETLEQRMRILSKIKKNNPKLKIFAFDLIMRCPQYSSNDEEPEYYGSFGLEIFKSGFIKHKIELKIASEDEINYYNNLSIPSQFLDDYLGRRDINVALNLKTIEYVKSKVIDFLIFPQDDAAQYGYTAKNQETIYASIHQSHLDASIYMYPGADEVANTLLSRMLCEIKNIKPKISIVYPSITSGQTIPLLEDRYLDTTVRYQIRAAGARVVNSSIEADMVLYVNASATKMASNAFIELKRDQGMTTLRNLEDFVEGMFETIHYEKKPVIVADVSTLNGSDHQLIQLMQQKNILLDLAAYAGWNTSSNTLGTSIPFGIVYYVYGKTEKHLDFLVSRYVEDYGYMAYVRTIVNSKLKDLGLSYFDVSKKEEEVVIKIQSELNTFILKQLSSIQKHIIIHKVWMPWHRMFEVGLEVKYKP